MSVNGPTDRIAQQGRCDQSGHTCFPSGIDCGPRPHFFFPPAFQCPSEIPKWWGVQEMSALPGQEAAAVIASSVPQQWKAPRPGLREQRRKQAFCPHEAHRAVQQGGGPRDSARSPRPCPSRGLLLAPFLGLLPALSLRQPSQAPHHHRYYSAFFWWEIKLQHKREVADGRWSE